jgi:uncharacterized protein DUF4386
MEDWEMDSDRKTALVAGALFIVATAASLLGTALESFNRISLGGLLELIAAGTSAGIAISLYPVLRRWSASLALGSVVFRAIEAVMYTVAAISLLALSRVGQQAVGVVLTSLRQEAVLAGVFAFSVGALMYYVVFFRSSLIPRWLSGWGIAAVLLMLVACLAALFSGNPVTSYVVLILPIAVQEMVLAVWLIARGFSSTSHLAESANPALAA